MHIFERLRFLYTIVYVIYYLCFSTNKDLKLDKKNEISKNELSIKLANDGYTFVEYFTNIKN